MTHYLVVLVPHADGGSAGSLFQIFPVVALKERAWKLRLILLRRQQTAHARWLRSARSYPFRIHILIRKSDVVVTAGRLSA